MKSPRSFSRHAWIVLLLCSLAFVGVVDFARLQRVLAVTAVGADDAQPDPRSPTGWAGGKRWLLLTEPSGQAFESIALTQQMLDRGAWRVGWIAYENAPTGRPVYSATPHRWWLALLAEIDHAVAGRPLGQSVERAVLVGDPLLFILLLTSAAIFVARRFGAASAAFLILGLAATFPFASTFVPAAGTDYGLVVVSLFWSLLLLVADAVEGRRSRAAHFLSGAAAGFALWLSVTASAPVLLAIVIGAILAALVGSRPLNGTGDGTVQAPPWRAWGAGGAIVCLIGYAVEYLPSHAGWDLRVNHPLYGLAWLGIVELLHRFAVKAQTGRWRIAKPELAVGLVILASIAPLVVALFRIRDWRFVAGDLASSRISALPDAPSAESFLDWLHGKPHPAAWIAVVLPVLLLAPAVWRVLARQTPSNIRAAIALVLGPALAALALSFHHLHWWAIFDAAALVLLAATMSVPSRAVCWTCGAIVAAGCSLGVVQLLPGPALQTDRPALSDTEIRGLYERALAHWIADHADAPSVTVLAPPASTASFCYYGSLRGLGTAGWQNRDGLAASFQICSSTRTEDTLALLNKFGIRYVVLPGWDTALETMASMGVQQADASFIALLHQTAGAVFPWLRPLPYNAPPVPGFENSAVMIFQVGDEANPAIVQSRVLEYLVEMHQMSEAATASRWLQRYPADLGAQVALAQYAKAAADDAELGRLLASIVSYVQVGADRRLPWDRRISLAVILAIGGKEDLARTQVQRCLSLLNEERARTLTTGSLYHLMVLVRHFGLEITDPKTRALALKLLPAELRERL